MVLVFYKPLVLAGHLAVVMHCLHAGQERETLLCAEEPMTTVEFITALFDHVDEQLRTVPKHPEAHLWPSEVVTLGLLHALKGGGNRASLNL
jgi:hypothetical protein